MIFKINQNQSMNLIYKKATPGDVDIAVPLIYSSGPAAFEYVFKVSEELDAQRFLRYAFVRKGSEFSYDNHDLVCLDEEKVGTISTYSGKDIGGFTRKAMQYILQYYGVLKGIGVLYRGLKLEQIIAPPKGNTHYLAHVAVDPQYRGRGIGTAMMNDKIVEGVRMGRHTASLDVSIENPRAQALYENLGFEVSKINECQLKQPYSYLTTHFKMFKQLR